MTNYESRNKARNGGKIMRVLEGNVVGTGMKIGIVAARFNEFIVSKLVGGAEDALRRHEVDTENQCGSCLGTGCI